MPTATELERDMALPNIEVEGFAGITNGVTEVWIGDTGSSCHLASSDKGMINVREIHDSIKVGNGTTMDATKIGDLPVIITQKDGTKTKATLKGVKFVPKLWCNLFSIGNVLSKGWSLGNEGKITTLQKQQTIIKFDQVMTTKSGYVAGVKIMPQALVESTELTTNVNVNTLHG